jgi:DNA-binding LacI/PurR family transcriptional regulator
MLPDKGPLYRYIIEDIKRKIRNGELRPQDPLPSQIDLAKMYNTSEITSRRALAELVKEGYIYRVRGKGSFIRDRQAVSQQQERAVRTIYFVHNKIEIERFANRFWSEMIEGIHEECERNGVGFHLWSSWDDNRLPDDPNGGFIVLTTRLQYNLDVLKAWRDEGRKIVTVHFYYPHLNIPYVIADNLTGGYLATEHLLSLGHRRVGIIVTGKSLLELNQEFSFRLQGYRLALEQHHIPFDPELVCFVDGLEERTEMGYVGFQKLFQNEHPPTAVFATSDYKAVGAIHAARDMGLEVPKDVSVIGYDDLTIGQYTYPKLTTVNQNTRVIGRRAAEILLNYAAASPSESFKDEILPKLIVRESTSGLNRIDEV